jgi:hypothetical protein
MDSNRKYFTKHGLHLNSTGKEWLAKQIATQVSKLINNINKIDPVIAIKWKEETANMSINVPDNQTPNLISTDNDLSKVKHYLPFIQAIIF